MRREWLDRIEEIMNKVNSSASAVWDLHEIEELFDLGRETARKIMIAVGRINPDRNCHIETDKLKEFLGEFLTIISAGGNQKNQRRKAIEKATALYREKLAKAMEVEKDAKWEYFPGELDQELDERLKEAQQDSGKSRKIIFQEAIRVWLEQSKTVPEDQSAQSIGIPEDSQNQVKGEIGLALEETNLSFSWGHGS